MPEEKKPKIDLKARLGKASAAQTPPPPVAGPPPSGIPAPIRSAPPPIAPMPGVPVGPPPAFGSRPPPIDPNNPLAAVASPYRPSAQPVAPAPAHHQPQRIEVDDMAVQTASRSARKQGLVLGLFVALGLGVIGWVAGGAAQQGSDRGKSKTDAQSLSADVTKAHDALKSLADKMEAGGKMLAVDRKFPDTLAKELSGINVDFDGTKLAGRRFSGFPAETAHDLVEFITAVQTVNDRKDVVEGLLTRLQKPISEQLSTPQGQQNISYVVAVDRDPSGNLAGFLSPLSTPLLVTSQNISLPAKFQFTQPGGSGKTELPRYTGGDVSTKPAAIYIVPKTFEGACPSATSGQIAQLGAQMGGFVHDIRGDASSAQQDIVTDTKPGLLERAEKLVTQLNKI